MKKQSEGESGKTRVAVYFPTELYKRMRHRAIDDGKTASAFIVDAVEQYLKAAEKGKRG